MRTPVTFLILAIIVLISNTGRAQTAPSTLRVLYVGHRPEGFEPLLKKHFAKVKSVGREEFRQGAQDGFDVVLLDWPQEPDKWASNDDGYEKLARAGDTPLGHRAAWTKPTVLLGSAGMRMAVGWRIYGGSGCTCLAPVAHTPTNHAVFQVPKPIDLTKTVSISTPKAFANAIKDPTIFVIPLVDGIKQYATVNNDYRSGWSAHYYEFENMPEVERFSGGINEQTPRSAAFWRQGNLLHFGFEQPAAEMNDTGKAMLVNSIHYISRFTEDRPIAEAPSVFGKVDYTPSRRRATNMLSAERLERDYLASIFAPSVLQSVPASDVDARRAWVKANGMWFHPGKDGLIEVDQEARDIGIPFEASEFLPHLVSMSGTDSKAETAMVLLNRYVHDKPAANTAAGWKSWWQENEPYLFYSELGRYRWYVDPLAKARKIPTRNLRGPARADLKT